MIDTDLVTPTILARVRVRAFAGNRFVGPRHTLLEAGISIGFLVGIDLAAGQTHGFVLAVAGSDVAGFGWFLVDQPHARPIVIEDHSDQPATTGGN